MQRTTRPDLSDLADKPRIPFRKDSAVFSADDMTNGEADIHKVLRKFYANQLGRADQPTDRKKSWWIWPHLCSLDAPVVAVVWQHWWAQSQGTSLTWHEDALLALSVWLIYLADRLADVFSHADYRHDTARHHFADEHRGRMRPLVVGLFSTLSVMAPIWLKAHEFRMGLILLILTGTYFWAIHGWSHRRWKAFLPKEVTVAILFTLGTSFFVQCRSSLMSVTTFVSLAAFGALCFLNCALITRWESTERDIHDDSSLVNSFPQTVHFLPAGCVFLAVIAFVAFLVTNLRLFLPLTMSAALLGCLHHRNGKLSLDALRVLADVVLLTPLCFLLL